MKKALLILVVSLSLLACEEQVTYDLSGRNPGFLVVDGWISSKPATHEILLTRTRDFGDSLAAPIVTGAGVVVRWENGIEFLTETNPGTYVTSPDFALIPGETYWFEILVDEQLHVYESTVVSQPTLDEVAIDVLGDSVQIEVAFISTLQDASFAATNLFLGEVESPGDTVWREINAGLTNAELDVLDFEDDGFGSVELGIPLPETSGELILRVEVHFFNREQFNYLLEILPEDEETFFGTYPSNPPFVFSNQALGIVFNSSVLEGSFVID